MTEKQFLKKIEIARKTGKAYLCDGCTLYFSPGFYTAWSIESQDGNTVCTCGDTPEKHFDFMVD